MRAVYLFIILLNWETLCNEVPPAGHMQPLGSHIMMPPSQIDVLKEFPSALTFYNSYVRNNLPVKLQGLLKNTDVLKNWRKDDYLREKFGNLLVSVENRKKEDRKKESGQQLEISKFLDKYKTEDVYMTDGVPEDMKNEWPLPSFMLCGGYIDNIAFINAWLSSGNTKSVLHTDSFENLHCVISGTKTFILIEKKYGETIGSEFQSQGYFNLDVDSVDMNKYSGLATVPWYEAVIEQGDCLYLPYEWIHQVTSTGNRNMGVNVWWIRFPFNEEDCLNVPTNAQGFANIGQLKISLDFATSMKGFFLDMKREDGSIHATDVLSIQKQRTDTDLTIEQLNQAFEILLPGCNGILHEDQLTGTNQIPNVRYKEADTFIASMTVDHNDEAPSEQSSGEPKLPIIPHGGPPPEELEWEAEIVEGYDHKDEL